MTNETEKDVLLEDGALDLPAVDAPVAGEDDEFEIEIVDEAASEGADEGKPAEENPVETAEPQAVTEEDGEDDSDLDDETKEMRKHLRPKFKKRLDREIRVRRVAQAQLAEVTQKAQQVVQYAQTRDQEIASLRQQFTELQGHYADTLESSLTDKIQMKTQALKRARADGEDDKELALQSELDDMRYKLRQIKDVKATLTTQRPAQAQPQPQPQQRQGQVFPLAKKWLDSNKGWFGSQNFAVERAGVMVLDAQVAAEGYDKNSAEYYRELDRRIDEKYPSLRKKPTGKSSPVAPVAAVANPAVRVNGKTKVTLTKADFATMRQFGLDPSNKEHLREFVRQRRAAS